MSTSTDTTIRQREGVIAGITAYTLWGFLPIYLKFVSAVPAFEVLAHRIVWAVPFGVPIIALRRQWPEVRRALAHRRTFALLGVSAACIAVNWLIYILAVQRDQIFQASLGYYVNPLMYVLIGVAVFRERLRPLQTAALVLATTGVAVLTSSGGQFPYIALAVATSFTIYGVVRSRVAVGGMPGLFIETLVLAPAAAAYLIWLGAGGEGAFGAEGPGMTVLLMLAGPFTVLPLLSFALAARRVQLSTLGMMQYISPTLQFFVGVAYGEQLTPAHLLCFVLIWLAVITFSGDAWRSQRNRC